MNEIDIKQEPLLPFNFKIFGGIMIFGCFIFAATWGINEITILRFIGLTVFLLLGAFLLTARYGLKINVANRTYTVYTYFFGIKTGKPEQFHHIEKFYINQVTEKSRLATRGTTVDIRNRLFKAYMLLDTGEKVHVDTAKKEEVLNKRVEEYLKILKPVCEFSE